MQGDTVKLYLWEDCFYEVWCHYGDDKINSVEKLEDESRKDLLIQKFNRKGTPEIDDWDRDESLREVGKIVKPILERDHPEYLNKLYWEQVLNWFCQVIEVRAAYLVDDILKEKKMLHTEARKIAIERLLVNPQKHIKPPYVKVFDDNTIHLPNWTFNRRSLVGVLTADVNCWGSGISNVLDWIDSFGGWEDDTGEGYWEEQIKLSKESKQRRKQKGK